MPILGGGAGVLFGPAIVGDPAGSLDLDSHFRYLSGLLFAIGLGYASTVASIERQGPRLLLLTAIVAVGGVGRAVAQLQLGPPSAAMQAALAMELVVAPGLALWQRSLARRAPTRS